MIPYRLRNNEHIKTDAQTPSGWRIVRESNPHLFSLQTQSSPRKLSLPALEQDLNQSIC